MNLKLDIAGRRLSLDIRIIRKPYMEVRGVTSRCGDMKHVLYLEYDHICRNLVEDELGLLIQKFKLSPFYLFRSSKIQNADWADNEEYGNYHAINLTKNYVIDVLEIQNTTHMDFKYKKNYFVNMFKYNVLRWSDKGDKKAPEFIGIVGEGNLGNEVSTAHKNLLEKIYKVPKLKYTNEDGLIKTSLASYLTAHP